MVARRTRTAQEVTDAVAALSNLKDDRSVAIMGAAFMEYQLGRAILNRLVEMEPAEQEALLDNYGHGALITGMVLLLRSQQKYGWGLLLDYTPQRNVPNC
jgi:hypothetical protein